jgi:hypothetical protein
VQDLSLRDGVAAIFWIFWGRTKARKFIEDGLLRVGSPAVPTVQRPTWGPGVDGDRSKVRKTRGRAENWPTFDLSPNVQGNAGA